MGETTAPRRARIVWAAAVIGLSLVFFQITPVYSTEVSGYGVLDTSSVEKSIKAIVDAEFAVR